MLSTRHHRHLGYRFFSISLTLACMLVPCTGAWPQGKGLPVGDTQQRSAAKGLEIIVQNGKLSVNLQEADLGEVLMQIGRQAGIRILPGPSAGKRVSARFASIELEEGLRRLLRQSSLSHMFLYANGPAGTHTISELRVLGEGKETTPPPTFAEPGLHPTEPSVSTPAGKARRQPPGVVVEPVQVATPESGQGEPTEVTRRVREVFQLSKGMGNGGLNGQEASPNEVK